MLNDSAMSISKQALFRYRLWGRHIVSEIALGEIEQAPALSRQERSLPELYCKLLPCEGPAQPVGEVVLEQRTDNGNLWLALLKSGEDYLAWFPDLCIFRIRPREMRIECTPIPGTPSSTIVHLLLDHAIPRFLSLQTGYLVLHASAVLMDGHAVAILGQSGQGKSTLATYLASNGSSLLTDDCLVLRQEESAGAWLAAPGYASVRLWSDSSEALGFSGDSLTEFAHYTAKMRTSDRVIMRHARQTAPLDACLVLAPPAGCGEPFIKPLSVAETFHALLHAVFRLDPENAEMNRREFGALMDFMQSVRCYSLSYERDYALLPAVQKVIMESVQATQVR
jgi:hypothetical protein